MAKKDKKHEELHKIYKAGDKYHCGECGTEVNFGDNCPECNKKFDWSKIDGYLRR